MFNHDPSRAPELNSRQRLAVILLDVALLAEITLSVYIASRQPDEFTPVFMKVFFTMFIPTITAGIVAIRRCRNRPQGEVQA